MTATETRPMVSGRMVFRQTNAHTGRHTSVTPANSANRHLSYGRIILGEAAPFVSFDNGENETGLILLAGAATVRVDGRDHALGNTTVSIYPAIA